MRQEWIVYIECIRWATLKELGNIKYMENYKNLKLGGSADSERNRKQNLIEIAIKQKHTKKVDCFEDSSPGLHFRKISIPSELPGISKKSIKGGKSLGVIAKSYIMKHLLMQ